MTKTPISLPELRRRIYRKAKSETTHRFWGLFVHITKIETLEEAYRIAAGNGGAPGIDGQRFQDIESAGLAAFLEAVRDDLITARLRRKVSTCRMGVLHLYYRVVEASNHRHGTAQYGERHARFYQQIPGPD